MKRRTALGLCLIAAIGNARVSVAQESPKNATVTFYSHGNRWTTGLPGSNHGIFLGNVFSGENALFSFLEGFPARNNLAVSFSFPPGEYAFSASDGKHAPKKQISLTLNPGERYFFRAQSESRGIVEIEWERGRLDQISCEIASEETKSARLLAGKKVKKPFATSVVPTQIPIACP